MILAAKMYLLLLFIFRIFYDRIGDESDGAPALFISLGMVLQNQIFYPTCLAGLLSEIE
jgi:hypothetical protein